MPVRWTEPAETDFLSICDRIAATDSRAADRVARRVLDAIQSLEQMPRRGRVGRLSGTRELVVSGLPYIIVYTVRDAAPGHEPDVLVLRVIHGTRRWPGRAP